MILHKFIHKLDEFSLDEMIISKKYRSVKLKMRERLFLILLIN